jgi:DNA-binding CsgD family transcriptional regulator
MAKKDPDVFNILYTWDVYGSWAQVLGNLSLAKTCFENALLVARKYHLTGYAPRYCLVYAQLLSRAGQHETAYRYLLEAVSYDAQGDTIAILLASYGIPIALHVKDEVILAKCARPATIDAAFRNGAPAFIADVAAAFAQWHAACGREREAQNLLHRVTKEIQVTIDSTWRFPIVAAQYGRLSDLPRVREMLEKEDAVLLRSDLTQANLSLFDAFVARRKGQHSESHEYARAATELFTKLGWYECVDLAHELLPSGTAAVPDSVKEYTAFTHLLSVLSIREKQVAELVLQGRGNRAIAQTLSITERTVESHMTSILGHLGVRSRHQLMARFVPNSLEQYGNVDRAMG